MTSREPNPKPQTNSPPQPSTNSQTNSGESDATASAFGPLLWIAVPLIALLLYGALN